MPNGAHHEIELKAFDVVLEWTKQVVTIASATLVLSATFVKDMLSGKVVHQGCLTWAWVLLLVAVVSGVFVIGATVASLNKKDLDAFGGMIGWTAIFQVVAFLIGMILFLYFAGANLSVRRDQPSESKPASAAASQPLSELEDVQFGIESSNISEVARGRLLHDASALSKTSRGNREMVVIQGYCDQRGTDEHNVVLGYRRAKAARDLLVNLGVPASRMTVASCGKGCPICEESTEECWSKNRRVHIAIIE